MRSPVKLYLLSVEGLDSADNALSLRERALHMLDSHRRAKAEHMREGRGQDLAIGAGLLLQLAVQGAAAPERPLQAAEVLDMLSAPVEIAYCHGIKGKPDFQGVKAASGMEAAFGGSMHFNLSHSGEYVFCAVSKTEVGVDIQRMRPLSDFRLAERFFSSREMELILQNGEHSLREREFYRMWVRKEAYGKLTGEGIAATVGLDMDSLAEGICWKECPAVEGYRLAAYRYRTEAVQ